MKQFKDYLVILHNFQKRQKQMRITKAVSEQAAVRVANIKERMYGVHYDRYNATMCYQLDAQGNPIWNAN